MKAIMFPGQGSQFRGMGKETFASFGGLVAQADGILGYSIEDLCLTDPRGVLGQTEFTQPALYVVNALAFEARRAAGAPAADFLIGHSLGEYSALYAAGVFDFETGLKLVIRRSALMASAPPGGMAAVLGPASEEVYATLERDGLIDIDIANLNGPNQTVISGPIESLERAEACFDNGLNTFIPLNVSAAFHSRQMAFMSDAFANYLGNFEYRPPTVPVIANVTAHPYGAGDVVANLTAQVTSPVRWTEGMLYLMQQGPLEFEEVGPGGVLTKLADNIRRSAAAEPAKLARRVGAAAPSTPKHREPRDGEWLGSAAFRRRQRLRYACIAETPTPGAMSPALIHRLSDAGVLTLLDEGPDGEGSLQGILRSLGTDHGAAKVAVRVRPGPTEDRRIALCREERVPVVEASRYEFATPAIVRFKAAGLTRRGAQVEEQHCIIARVCDPMTADAFLKRPPEDLVRHMVADGELADWQANWLADHPLANEITVEPEIGSRRGLNDLTVVLPCILQKARQLWNEDDAPGVGAAGYLGDPAAIGGAFALGADYVVVGSLAQCTVESALSESLKDALQELGILDTASAPAIENLSAGALCQVVARGSLFPTRANRLFNLWKTYGSWEAAPRALQDTITEDLRSLAIPRWGRQDDVAPNEAMLAVVRSYLAASLAPVANGGPTGWSDVQVRAGPDLGAFNAWARTRGLADWRQRHVDEVIIELMEGAASHLKAIASGLRADAGVQTFQEVG